MLPDWTNKLERKWGFLGVKNLMLYIIIGQVFLFFVITARPELASSLYFADEKLLVRQWWRFFWIVFLPPTTELIFFLFVLYFEYIIYRALEDTWGEFKATLFFFISFLSVSLTVILLAFFDLGSIHLIKLTFLQEMGLVTWLFAYDISFYVFASLTLAFAFLNPHQTFYLFLVIPFKAMYLGWLIAFILLVRFFAYDGGFLLVPACVLNFFLFFGGSLFLRAKSYQRRQVYDKKQRQAKPIDVNTCAVCQKSSFNDDEINFRYCTECDPPLCFCEEHLKNHEHIQ